MPHKLVFEDLQRGPVLFNRVLVVVVPDYAVGNQGQAPEPELHEG